ncbi:Glycosyl hydrolases family 18 [Pseudovibrio sp. W64]|uniref:glycoside hydrolase family 18 protein n=1 Tax=unclassified Pseudovibrio TaxID=2627060 RepID=UPI0007AE9860|nr:MULTISPECIES: glycoside hydrolase family 18 protein [unclassified Pseudovibrio]KZK80481.1 Glycosyl hydrolases family 18 [Pseudovibrio sp. Ad13]KZK89842.1 Glycosyl hydrolases family 18 [Pseudovibrio sp. W64]
MPNKEIVGYALSTNTQLIAEMAQSDYTTVILCFVVSDEAGNLSPSTELQAMFNAPDLISNLKKAGKRVLISIGGEVFTTAAWAALSNNLDNTAQQLTKMVIDHGLDGVDIDWEDTNYSGYDAPTFLADLSKALKSKLPEDQNFVTHAPQAPYFYGGAGYLQVYVDVAKNAGDTVDLYNIQYYNNQWYVGETAEEETGKVAGTEPVGGSTFPSSIIGIASTGVPISKLILGKPTTLQNVVGSAAVNGYLPADEIVDNLITPLLAKEPDFAGVMGWQYPTQYGSDTGTDEWAATMAKALGN